MRYFMVICPKVTFRVFDNQNGHDILTKYLRYTEEQMAKILGLQHTGEYVCIDGVIILLNGVEKK